MRRAAIGIGVLIAGAALAPGGAAQPSAGWAERRCARYAAAWTEGLARFGTDGLGAEFLRRHAAFLEAGCRGPREVCPRSPAELAMADVMSAAAVNAGATGSFLPFACRE